MSIVSEAWQRLSAAAELSFDVYAGDTTPNVSRMLRFTRAEGQATRRDLKREWIEAAIAHPDWTAPDPDPALTRSCKAILEAGSKVLRVVHRPAGDDILIVTALFDRGARR